MKGKKTLSARTRMANFVSEQTGTMPEIRKKAVVRFRNDKDMIETALSFLAYWEGSNNAHVLRTRAVREVLSSSVQGVFDNMEEYVSRVDGGRLLTMLDLTKSQILALVDDRRPVVMGELRHLDCLEAIAQSLPAGSTPRSYFEKRPGELYSIIQTFYGKEEAA